MLSPFSYHHVLMLYYLFANVAALNEVVVFISMFDHYTVLLHCILFPYFHAIACVILSCSDIRLYI